MIERIRHIQGLLDAELPRGEFALVHSAWFSVIGLRSNGDLDLIISSMLRRERFADVDPERHFGLPGPLERRIRIQPANSDYAGVFGARDLDDVIYNNCVEIDGLRFVEPRFYFEIKRRRLVANRGRWRALSWWRRAAPTKHRRKLAAKIRKDETDLVAIKAFLARGGHREPELAHVPDSAWGVELGPAGTASGLRENA